jgi:hypothetical protein
MTIRDKVAEAIALAESKKPYSTADNPYGQFPPENYLDLADAALCVAAEYMLKEVETLRMNWTGINPWQQGYLKALDKFDSIATKLKGERP